MLPFRSIPKRIGLKPALHWMSEGDETLIASRASRRRDHLVELFAGGFPGDGVFGLIGDKLEGVADQLPTRCQIGDVLSSDHLHDDVTARSSFDRARGYVDAQCTRSRLGECLVLDAAAARVEAVELFAGERGEFVENYRVFESK